MLKRKLLIAATLIAATASSTFAGWVNNVTIKNVGVSNDSKTLVVTVEGQKEWYNGKTRDKHFFVTQNSKVPATMLQMQHQQLLTAIETNKKINIGASDKRENLWGQPGYRTNTFQIRNK